MNRYAREGLDRCACGAKYWEHDQCVSCGSKIMLTNEELEWIDYGRSENHNPIIRAFAQHVMDVEDGADHPEDGLETDEDVLVRWIDYLADGDQEVSWYEPVLEQANDYFRRAAEATGVPYRPGMTEPAA